MSNLLFLTARKNLLLNRKIELLSKRTTREKLLAFLLMKAKESGSSRFRIPYDRQMLADYLGVERSAMCSELSRMRREGFVEYQKNRFFAFAALTHADIVLEVNRMPNSKSVQLFQYSDANFIVHHTVSENSKIRIRAYTCIPCMNCIAFWTAKAFSPLRAILIS